ncbi:diadenosine tetraphosphate hydrolase [Pyrodictium occultum]|uniref:Diadenosine tetraphosphate hydrolase n=1 Tax=Pyrodictium occultum TaxID=2309 RepID=A0A0V8RVI1_PYROC|nr:HIT family protein [Pyrodictium occultum]KSW12051.1 diadenosine tetraphosphate hydrolase [Pyrodictium occultum]
MTEDCVFCKIIRGELPSAKVYEDENVVAFLDIYPINPGHTLVVPKRHVERLEQLSDEEAAALIRVVKKLAPRIVEAVGAQGYNVVANNGRAAGQVIFHVHFHIVPRFEGDGCQMDCSRSKPSMEELREIGEKIKRHLEH